MRSFRWLNWGLSLLTGLLASAGIWVSVTTIEEQGQLLQALRYNTVFDAGQALDQLLRLEADLAASTMPGSPVDADGLRLRLDVLLNQVSVIENGAVRSLLETDSDASPLLALFASTVRALDTGFPSLGEPGAVEARLDALRALNAPMSQLIARTHERSGDEVLGFQRDLSRSYWTMLALMLGLVGSGIGLVAVLMHRSRAEGRIARRDALTGLPNRRAVYECLDALRGEAPLKQDVAVLLLDLDLFKNVNDTLGHHAGDLLLIEFARRLSHESRNAALIARPGGDEFAVVLRGEGMAEEAGRVAQRICAAASLPVRLGAKTVQVGVSVGIAVSRATDAEPRDLLRCADLALYATKAAGRGGFLFYTDAMHDSLKLRQETEADLRQALARNQMELWFQPIVDLASGAVVSSEALLRWRHPVRGLVSPADFIPLAEETGIIEGVGEWVIEEACRVAASWTSEVRVSVNLSARQFRDARLPDIVAAALRRTGLPARRLELEITESALIQDTALASRIMEKLRALGTRIALDDFGTGYASLAYIDRFALDKIKIDKSFVRKASQTSRSLAIVELITGMANRLGIVTTAEGIEDYAEVGPMRQAGCTEGQGYAFARPMPSSDFGRYLENCAGPPRLAA